MPSKNTKRIMKLSGRPMRAAVVDYGNGLNPTVSSSTGAWNNLGNGVWEDTYGMVQVKRGADNVWREWSGNKRGPPSAATPPANLAGSSNSTARVHAISPAGAVLNMRSTNAKASGFMNQALSAAAANTKNVAAMLSLPHEHPPVRFADEYTGRPTAIASPYIVKSFSVAQSTLGAYMVMAFRDLLRSVIEFVPNAGLYNYAVQFPNYSPSQPNQATFTVQPSQAIPIPFCCADFVGGGPGSNAVHGQKLYAGTHQNRRGFWMNEGDAFQVTPVVAGSLSPLQTTMEAYYLTGGEWVSVLDVLPDVLGAVISVSVINTGYWAFEIFDNRLPPTPYDITANIVSSTSMDKFAHLCMTNVQVHEESITGARVMGVGLLVSNTAPTLNNNGNCAMTQFDPGVDIADVVNQYANGYQMVSQDTNAYVGSWINGMYGFLKPSDPADFHMQHPFSYDPFADVMQNCSFPLVPTSGYLCAVFQVSVDAGSTTYSAGAGHYIMTTSVEFSTTDIWFNSENPGPSDKSFEQAAILLRPLPQFHENPLHFSDIMGWIKKIGQQGAQYGVDFMTVLSKVLGSSSSPMLHTLVGTAGSLLKLYNKKNRKAISAYSPVGTIPTKRHNK
jgi:hypothetical protein